jgi:guanylate kinase
LRAYTDEVKALREYDTVIVNQDFDAAVAQFEATVEARRTVSKRIEETPAVTGLSSCGFS